MSERADDRAAAEVGVAPAELRRFWSEQVRSHWRLLLGIGIGSELVGIFSILVPIVAPISVAILAGWILLVGGVVQFGHVRRQTAGWDRVWRLFLAAVTAVAGLSLLRFPLSGTIAIGLVSVLLGALIWASLPSSAAWAIGLLLGIELILYGMSLTSAGLAGRRLDTYA